MCVAGVLYVDVAGSACMQVATTKLKYCGSFLILTRFVIYDFYEGRIYDLRFP